MNRFIRRLSSKMTLGVLVALVVTVWVSGEEARNQQEDQERALNASRTDDVVPKIGARVTPRGPLEAWERYPSGILFNQGRKLGNLDSSEVYEVIGSKIICSLSEKDDLYYLKIRPVQSPSNESTNSDCWVYLGRPRDFETKRPNLVFPEDQVVGGGSN